MKPYTLQQRCAFYNTAFHKWPDSHLWVGSRFIRGIWMIGNNFRNKSNYYGAYPRGYLQRVMSMFPDTEKILHLFSGSLRWVDLNEDFPNHKHILLDINGNGDDTFIGHAEEVAKFFEKKYFDLCLADPPYSIDDQQKYKIEYPVNRGKVMREVWGVMQSGSYMVWLDQVKPMFRKDQWHFCGTIGVDRSTNHRVRMVYIFRRKKL